ncbi:MAG: hypothetical protein ACFFAU_10735 [Candidatus Hodarchaeota archaeon]
MKKIIIIPIIIVLILMSFFIENLTSSPVTGYPIIDPPSSPPSSAPSTYIIRPNGDVGSYNFYSPPLWSKVDENVQQPTAGDGNYIYGGYNAHAIFDMSEFKMEAGKVCTGIKACVYGKTSGLTEFVWGSLSWRTQEGNSWSKEKTPSCYFSTTYRWSNVSWSGLALSQTDLNNLQVRIAHYRVISRMTANIYTNTLYLVITYDNPPPPSWSVHGTITDIETRQGIEGVAIELHVNHANHDTNPTDYTNILISSTSTDSNGLYKVSGSFNVFSNTDNVWVKASKIGYCEDYHDLDIDGENYIWNSNLQSKSYSLSWIFPAPGDVIFGVGPPKFNISYSKTSDIDTVKLYLNSIDMGKVSSNDTVEFTYNQILDGNVTAELKGYENGVKVESKRREFYFRKKVFEQIEKVDEGYEFIGTQLYSILHDPNGDRSYSHFTKSQIITDWFEHKINYGASLTIAAKAKASLFGTGVAACTELKVELEGTNTWKHITTITDTTDISSNFIWSNPDPDYVGPGFGDTYWGEAWGYRWICYGTHIEWYSEISSPSGKITQYLDPYFEYGINRSHQVLLSDDEAPEEWRQLNPHHNDYQNVEWFDQLTVQGGIPYSKSYETKTTEGYEHTYSLKLSSKIQVTFSCIFAEAKKEIELHFKYAYSAGHEKSTVRKTEYIIYDTEETDLIINQIGVDKTFGTPIFRAVTGMPSLTSNPYEHNTADYTAPYIDLPTILMDTDGDNLGPTQADTPLVEVDITEEDLIARAYIRYSIDGGSSWKTIDLENVTTQQIYNPDRWIGKFPKHNHGTTVLWYIRAEDRSGSGTDRKNPYGNYFTYTVINRHPIVKVLSPNGGEKFLDIVNITWTGVDPDGDSLLYTVSYNSDNEGWHLLITDSAKSFYQWNITSLPDSKNVLIKVSAKDGFGGNSEDTCDTTFGIDHPTLTVKIIYPNDGEIYSQNVPITWQVVTQEVINYSTCLTYSSDGIHWYSIGDGIVGDTFVWNTTNIPNGTNYRVRIVITGEYKGFPLEPVEDTSDGTFIIIHANLDKLNDMIKKSPGFSASSVLLTLTVISISIITARKRKT